MGVGFQFRILKRQSFGPEQARTPDTAVTEAALNLQKTASTRRIRSRRPVRVTGSRYSSSESGGDGLSLLPVARADAKASPEKRNLCGFHFP
jgi:hypothetical protein